MKKVTWPYILIPFIGLILLISAIVDIVYDYEFLYYILGAFIVIVIMIIILIISQSKKPKITSYTIEEFEKSLKGGLYHFKCPTCSGIFALKKSKADNKKNVKMTCPDCGAIGFITPNPICIEEEIPEKKSMKANFRCIDCGEGITIWAEGTELYRDVKVFSCPFCGEEETMKNI
jgi:predicted RNA-binding Zn-ribbon protein involved in translation (DUF1610 family)